MAHTKAFFSSNYKKVFLFLFIGAASLMMISCAHASKDDVIEVYVDQHAVEFSIDPYLHNGTTLVQLRPLFEALGIELEWIGETKTVIGTKGKDEFQLNIGESTAIVNGQTVSLALPARLTDGHTLVPLRFVSEATGSEVGWHGASRTIQVYSNEYLQILDITKEQAEQIVNAAPLVQSKAGQLRGFYARGHADLLGNKGCRGMCWDYFYFINDEQLIRQPPPSGGADFVDCAELNCESYRIQGEQLVIEDGPTYELEILEDGIRLNGYFHAHHQPLHRPKLDGIYTASSYIGGLSGGGFATTSTFVFRPDGTFLDDRFIAVITDGSDFSGDGSGVSSTHLADLEANGTYTVIGHYILLEYDEGAVESFLFFRPDLNDRMFKIGGRDFLISEHIELAEEELDEDVPNVEETQITDPFLDKLLTDNIANKTIIKQHNPESYFHIGVTEIVLHSYQWADLDIHADYIDSFSGFGEGPIVALTVNYTMTNHAEEALDLSTLHTVIWIDDGYVTDSPQLSPSGTQLLAAGESEERLAVFLFPAEVLQHYSVYELVFSELETVSGLNAVAGFDIDFDIQPPY